MARTDVLYDVRRPVLGVLLSGIRGPSTVAASSFEERLAELTAEPVAETDELRNQALRRRLTRRLLEDPVLYYDELDDDERGYLLSQRHAITRRIADATGLVAEMRAEGIAIVEPGRRADRRADARAAPLLVAERSARDQATLEELHAFVRQVAAEHATYWRKGVTEPGAETELAGTALEKLSALRLVGRIPWSAAARRSRVSPWTSRPSAKRERRRPMLPAPSSERWKPLRVRPGQHVLLRRRDCRSRRPSAAAR